MKKLNDKIQNCTESRGFLSGSGSDNGSRIKCGMTERACGTTKRGDSESGRSMVEMLGTLAIMGVLAIGGVAGYRWAMDKYRANDILNEVRKRAVVASQQRFGGSSTISFAEYGDNLVHGYALSGTPEFKGNNEFFTISVANVDKEICENLIAQEMPLSVGIQLNGADITDECTDGATNTVAFGFSNTLDPNADVTAGGGNGGTQTPSEPADPNACPNEGEYRDANGECVTDAKNCAKNMFYNGKEKKCVDCPSATGIAVANSSSDLNDNCIKCDGAQAFGGDWGDDSWCVWCPSGTTACGTQCCEENQRCQPDTSRPYTYTCVSAECTSDSDCANTANDTNTTIGKPLCDTYTGQCEWGCKDNGDCPETNGQKYFCDLDVTTTGYSCTQKPGSGTCKAATLRDTNGITTPGGKTVYRSASSVGYLNWWSAENFCKAIGKGSGQLVDPKDHCSNWSSIKSEGYGTCAELKIDSSDHSYYWTKRLRTSCNAFGVCASDGGVYRDGYRNDYDGHSALCE